MLHSNECAGTNVFDDLFLRLRRIDLEEIDPKELTYLAIGKNASSKWKIFEGAFSVSTIETTSNRGSSE